jgi:hypothetical protein
MEKIVLHIINGIKCDEGVRPNSSYHIIIKDTPAPKTILSGFKKLHPELHSVPRTL